MATPAEIRGIVTQLITKLRREVQTDGSLTEAEIYGVQATL